MSSQSPVYDASLPLASAHASKIGGGSAHDSRLEACILARIAAMTNGVVGKSMGMHGTTISRIKSGERSLRLNEFDELLDACGIRWFVDETVQVVPADWVCMPKEHHNALTLVGELGMKLSRIYGLPKDGA